MRFSFESELSRASTPPPWLYYRPQLLEHELQTVFARTWQLVGRAEQLAEHGAFVCSQCAGVPIVLLRDAQEIRGFHNVCAHRAGPVAQGHGRRKTLQCLYHGWTYRLDGALARAPEMEGTHGFDPGTIGLRPVAVEQRGPLVFAALEPSISLDEQLGSVRLGTGLSYVMSRAYEVKSNWKVYVDNYLEGYHLPIVHPELHRELDYDNYQTVLSPWSSQQIAPLRPLSSQASPRVYKAAAKETDAAYHWIFPNMMLNIYQGQLQTNLVLPSGPEACRVVFEWYATEPPDDPTANRHWNERIELSELTQRQDASICEAVQRNLRSPACRPGRYCAKRESGVHHFHGLLHRMLGTCQERLEAPDL